MYLRVGKRFVQQMQGYTKLANAAPPLCIATDEDGMTFESTDLGRVMAKYCVALKTMVCLDFCGGFRASVPEIQRTRVRHARTLSVPPNLKVCMHACFLCRAVIVNARFEPHIFILA
jgi:hypothetical protein